MKKTFLMLSLGLLILAFFSLLGSVTHEVKAYEKPPEYHQGERCRYPYVGTECVTWVSTGNKCSVYYNCSQTS